MTPGREGPALGTLWSRPSPIGTALRMSGLPRAPSPVSPFLGMLGSMFHQPRSGARLLLLKIENVKKKKAKIKMNHKRCAALPHLFGGDAFRERGL